MNSEGESTPRSLPFGDETSVYSSTFGRVILAQEHVAAATQTIGQRDDCLPRLFMESV